MNDALSNILQTFELGSSVYFQSAFHRPWGMDVDQSPFAQFHMVVRGACLIYHAAMASPVQLSAGDIIVFPHGTSHWLADQPSSQRKSGKQVVEEITQNSNTLTSSNDALPNISDTIICGHFEWDKKLKHPFLNSLPTMIHIKNNDQQVTDRITTTANLLIQESNTSRQGANLIIERLAEILLVHVFRAFLDQNDQDQGFAKALLHPSVARSIDAIHTNPHHPWTIELLARHAGMSRTAFAVLFKKLTGSTPMQYCFNWRMILAYRYLLNTSWSIPDLAERVGYRSEAAFNRAFKRHFAETPASTRRSALAKSFKLNTSD